MTLIELFSVTYSADEDAITVEVFDREADAVERGQALAGAGLYVRLADHELVLG